MIYRRIWQISALASILLTAAIWPHTAEAYPVDDSVTVVTTDGDTLVAHRYEVQERFQNLKLWVGRRVHTVRGEDIRTVLRNGHDVTEEMHKSLRDQPSVITPPEQSAIPRAVDEPDELSEGIPARNRWFFTAMPMYSFVLGGDLYDEVEGGLGYQFAIHVSVSGKINLVFNAGRSGVAPIPLPEIPAHRIGGTVSQYFVGVEAVKPADPVHGHWFMLYAGTMLGITSTDMRVRIWSVDHWNPQSRREVAISRRLYVGGGVMLGNSIGLHVQPAVNNASARTGSGDTFPGWSFDLGVGLLILM